MAHELTMVDGQAQMAYVGDTPWHGLGVPVQAGISPQEMMDVAGLNWHVKKTPLTYTTDEGTQAVPSQSALIVEESGQFLSVVGNDWNPIQNHEAFELFNEFCENGDMEMNTAGSLKDNQIVWGLAKVKKSFSLKTPQGEDIVDSYFLFSNPHQFGRAADVRFTPIRVVCNNTLTLSLNSKSQASVKVSHRTAFDKDSVLSMLGLADQKMDTYQEAAELLVSKKAKHDDLVKYFNEIFPNTYKAKVEKSAKKFEETLSKTAKKALNVLETQPGAELGAGTWWSAFNAATYLVDHEIGRGVDTRLQSAWFGQGQQKKTKALMLATEMAS